MLKLIAVFLCVLHSQAETIEQQQQPPEDIFDFQLCPESHPSASVDGQNCNCNWYLNSDTCDFRGIDCPTSKCEDLYTRCYTELLSKDDKRYQQVAEYLEGNRPIYKADNDDDCVWWEKSERRWWSGPCENVGTSSGFAYLAEDYRCPYGQYGKQADWKRGGSDDVVDLFSKYPQKAITTSNSGGFLEQNSAGPADESPMTATAAVNVIVRNGRYKQTCRFVYRNGIFKCENNSS
jgi:hypothetical protein